MFAQVKKTWNDISTVGIPPFLQARAYIEKIIRGEVSPEVTQALHQKAIDTMNSRKGRGKKRMSHLLDMQADGTVRRPSGLFVPPKYKDS